MAYIHINDNYPESADYDDNYLIYDGSCTTTAKDIKKTVSTGCVKDPIVLNRLKNICDSSLVIKKASRKKNIFKKMRRLRRAA